ncbi:pyridoxal phosphate-dependent aminotransferase [Intrasporangium chromatireducens Q5-1]|uniref:Pyridoxal phosphate-dependent aminotransferase n=1 Tax=Intrasporangium chromatireducens Q5-1 TaxID=584657 RepID=W9GRW5_9MICO|nr:DegT/DnrJ/EryC1/StrS family aminotransferase [Intrasporangium chromatireducens]EWT07548.1 pyridoxal phosphate-dependent aminotransferase [Intrasporangium chromatireducens Q5-1]
MSEAHAPGARGPEGTIPLAVPNIGDLERRYVLEAVESGFVSSVGPFVAEFERRFAERVGAKHAVACSTGTAAIHIGLILLGVRRGDDVVCSDFTFVGSVAPIAYLGARPVLVDSEERTWNLDPALLAEELERRARVGEAMPKVVEVVHALGQPADLAPIVEVCERFGVAILEDAAESLGSGWSTGPLAGRQTGTVGAVGCFSFNGNKIATTGGGGMIVTDDDELAARARHLTTQAKVADVGYLHDEVGYNYRLTNLAAGLGLAQLERLDEFVGAKHRIAARYDVAFADLPLVLPPRLAGLDATYWLYSVLVPETDGRGRDELLGHLSERGVGARALWRPLHLQPPYAGAPVVGGTVGQALFERGVSLPCATELTEADQDRVVRAVRSFFS